MAKIEPAVTQLVYLVPDGASYIDIAKDLSIVNRRLYRQGYTYVIQDIQLFTAVGMRSTDIASMQFSTMGNSWMVHNAWKKAFRVWRQQQKEVTDALPGIQGKWADFKIYLDDSHEDSTQQLAPYAGDGAVYTGGDWDHSRFVFDDDGTERYYKMHMIGSSDFSDTNDESAIGLIHEYAHSRPNVHIAEPDVESEASDTIYAKLLGTDEMSDLLVGHMENENDVPPYDQDEFPGGETNADVPVVTRWMSVNANQGMTTSAGFIVPCGLLKVDSTEYSLSNTTETLTDVSDAGTAVVSPGPNSVFAVGTAATNAIILTIAPGPYRGVLAAPMGQ